MSATTNIIDKNWKALIKPNKLDINSNDDKTVAKVVAEPLEKGFGQTIGNSLRRILLSSIQGAAVTAIQIDGVLHEFSSIKGVREDVTDIVLNVKNLAIKSSTSNPKKITIANTNTAANAFTNFGVSAGSGSASGSSVVADSTSDTLTFIAGSGITLTSDSNNDQITIESTASGSGSQNIFQKVSAPNQSTITAGSTTDTLNFDSSTDSSSITTRDGQVDIETDTSTKKVTLKAKIPITHSHSGKMPLVLRTGNASGVPLKNHFIPVTTTDTVNGGGSTVAMSTRAIEILQSDGSTLSRVIMPPTSNGKSLVFTRTLTDGTTETEELDMGE